MSKLPAILFYPADWLKDDVAGCSLAAQGLWLRMMIVMHSCEPYGHLSMNGEPMSQESVARRCGCTPDEFAAHFEELSRAGVPSRNADGFVYSRRMVRDAQLRAVRAKVGRKGGKQSGLARSKIEAKPQAKVKQNLATANVDELPDVLRTDEFKKAWDNWCAYRKEIGHAMKPSTMRAQLANMGKHGAGKSILAIGISIEKGWVGVFPEKVTSPCARQDAAFRRRDGSDSFDEVVETEVRE